MENSTTADDLLLPSQVAAMLGVSKDTVRTRALSGQLPFVPAAGGKLRLYRRRDVDAEAARSGNHPPAAPASASK